MGGEDISSKLAEFLTEKFKQENRNIDFSRCQNEILNIANDVKIELTGY